MTAILSAATGWLLLGSITGVLGAVGARWCLVRAGPGPESGIDLEPRLRRMGIALAALLFAALLAVLVRQVAEFRDPFAPLSEDLSLLVSGTPWGDAWIFGMMSATLILIGFALAGWGRAGWILATVGALFIATFPARTGHANAVESFRWIALGADTIHVLAAGLWLGGLGALLLMVSEVRKAGEGAQEGVGALVRAFSPIAQLCVACVVVTGLAASWIHLPSVGALFTTGYGRILLLKLALVACALLLGWINWKRVTPRLGEEQGRDALVRLGTSEFLVLQVVLVGTAFLVRTSPM